MSVYWSGSCSQRPFFSGGRATLTGIRRLVSPRRRVVPARAVAAVERARARKDV